MAEAVSGTRVPNSQTSLIHDPTPPAPLDRELVQLGHELAAVQSARDAFEASNKDPDREDPNYEAHYAARAKIDAVQATGLVGLAVKARAAELAARYDVDLNMEDAGSFVGLAQSIIRDLKAIEARGRATGTGGNETLMAEAKDREPLPIEIVDRLNKIRNLVEVAFMAAMDLQRHHCDPMQALLDHISDEMKDLSEKVLGHANEAEGDAND